MRKKQWRNPGFIYLNEMKVSKDFQLFVNFELFVELLRGTVCTYEKSNTPFSYILCLLCKKPTYMELNLKRALDEDTGVSLLFSSSVPLDQTTVSRNSTLHQ